MITLFLFAKGTAGSSIENLVAQAQIAVSLDTLERLQQISQIQVSVVSTGSAEFAARAAALGAQIEMDPVDTEFRFGNRLAALIAKYQASVPLYIGGGSGAVMQTRGWQNVVDETLKNPGTIVTNNYYSCDFAAWSPGNAIDRISPPALDNDLAYRLGERGGLKALPLPKNAATQLDVDTPADLLMLAFHAGIGRNMREFLEEARLDTHRVQTLRALLQAPSAVILIAGRVSASMALFLERSTRCQWRILSEERGMRASGREERGEVRSLLGDYLEHAGPTGLFESIAKMADGAIIDTRVLFAHRGLRPAAPDRFYSDLMETDKIQDPFTREFTAAAASANIPVLLGGHSLVSGGMYALAEE